MNYVILEKLLYTVKSTLQIDTGCSTPTSNHTATNCTHTELKHVWLITCCPSWTYIHSVAADIWWLTTWVERTNSHSVPIKGRGSVVPRNSEGLSWVSELHSRSVRRHWVFEWERINQSLVNNLEGWLLEIQHNRAAGGGGEFVKMSTKSAICLIQ